MDKGGIKMIYGYGIVDKDGNPWWKESCVCDDRAGRHRPLGNPSMEKRTRNGWVYLCVAGCVEKMTSGI